MLRSQSSRRIHHRSKSPRANTPLDSPLESVEEEWWFNRNIFMSVFPAVFGFVMTFWTRLMTLWPLRPLWEFTCMCRVKIAMRASTQPQGDKDSQLVFELLTKTSRSFAVVIQNLTPELREATCVYYLVLRALDTVEDDVNIPHDCKVDHLKKFHTYLESPDKVPADSGYGGPGVEGAYGELMANFPTVVKVLNRQKPEYQRTVVETTQRMAEGMIEFLGKQNAISTVNEYNHYCFYVAGLVGLGLSDLFTDSALEELSPRQIRFVAANPSSAVASAYGGTAAGGKSEEIACATAMGLFLQKTNIIRDYLEDIVDERLWWPKEVWSRWAEKPDEFRSPQGTARGRHCLNQLIADALQHLPLCLDYLSKLRDPSVFAFCAIPQAMALATLARLTNNDAVFRSVVKAPRGESCRVMIEASNMKAFERLAHEYVTSMLKVVNRALRNEEVKEPLEEMRESLMHALEILK